MSIIGAATIVALILTLSVMIGLRRTLGPEPIRLDLDARRSATVRALRRAREAENGLYRARRGRVYRTVLWFDVHNVSD